ncbi:hypothetical protein [Sulfuriroseicoccus oceanibius]|uniref:Uncharacterized protein n=1 Tax=Sulfuriroseicoccus oceanibius TaxID=2707525 RepID=A0A6B3L821_9BACT|nr:hypothetical protein [Sulfuriroseicoccus oceanibius]QQL44812.1 hypothetical protein G3M56_013170 [Sulfuriroseicoccus oceanibius]
MTARESRLLILTILIGMGIATWLVWSWADEEKAKAKQRIEEAGMRKDRDEQYLKVWRAEVVAVREWLKERNVPSMTLANASSMLLNRAQEAASRGGVRLDDVKFLDVISESGFEQARMTATITDTEENIYQSLMAFHDPERLQVVRALRVQPDKKEQSQIVADVEMRLYYKPLEAEVADVPEVEEDQPND